MIRSFPALADLHRLRRFTFAGRGCRDPRREPRRRPDVSPSRPGLVTAPPAAALVPARPAAAPGPSGARHDATSALCIGRTPAADRPPPAAAAGLPGWPAGSPSGLPTKDVGNPLGMDDG